MSLLLGLALAGCGGGGGYSHSPRIALPPGAALATDAGPAPLDRTVGNGQRAPMIHEERPLPAVVPAQDIPPEVAQNQGPHGTSGEVHEDRVGYAALMADPPEPRWSNVAVGVAYAGLPPGTMVELTALDTGRTIVALVVGRETGGALVALSPGTAQALGVADRAAVRIRSVVANPQDELGLRSGQAASPRLDAPPALLTALRRKLPGQQNISRVAAPVRSAPPRRTAPPVVRQVPAPKASRGDFAVQVATLSSAERAASLARDLGGHVVAAGGLYRVQLGPFSDMASATRARDGVARHGYRDARILHNE